MPSTWFSPTELSIRQYIDTISDVPQKTIFIAVNHTGSGPISSYVGREGNCIVIRPDYFKEMNGGLTDAHKFALAHEVAHINSETVNQTPKTSTWGETFKYAGLNFLFRTAIPTFAAVASVRKLRVLALPLFLGTAYAGKKVVKALKRHEEAARMLAHRHSEEFRADALAATKVTRKVLTAGIAYLKTLQTHSTTPPRQGMFAFLQPPQAPSHPPLAERIARLEKILLSKR